MNSSTDPLADWLLAAARLSVTSNVDEENSTQVVNFHELEEFSLNNLPQSMFFYILDFLSYPEILCLFRVNRSSQTKIANHPRLESLKGKSADFYFERCQYLKDLQKRNVVNFLLSDFFSKLTKENAKDIYKDILINEDETDGAVIGLHRLCAAACVQYEKNFTESVKILNHIKETFTLLSRSKLLLEYTKWDDISSKAIKKFLGYLKVFHPILYYPLRFSAFFYGLKNQKFILLRSLVSDFRNHPDPYKSNDEVVIQGIIFAFRSLHVSCHSEVVSILLTIAHVDIAKVIRNEFGALHLALKYERMDVINQFPAENMPFLVEQSVQNQKPLDIAFKSNRKNSSIYIVFLLKHGAKLEMSHLFFTMLYHEIDMVIKLLKAGADPHATGNNSALIYAVRSHIDTLPKVNLLLEHKVDVNYRNPENKTTALKEAAIKGEIGVMLSLLKAGADADIQDTNGHSIPWLVHFANTLWDPYLREKYSLDFLMEVKLSEVLSKLGGIQSVDQASGDTPLITAIKILCGRRTDRLDFLFKFIEFILEHKPDIGIKNKEGYSAFMYMKEYVNGNNVDYRAWNIVAKLNQAQHFRFFKASQLADSKNVYANFDLAPK